MKHYIRIYFIVVFFFSISMIVNAQGSKSFIYDTTYVVNPNFRETIKFNYTLSANIDTVKNGPYYYERRLVDPSTYNKQEILKIDGNYLNNLKEGRWKIVFLNHQLKLLDIIRSKRARFDIETVKDEIICHFESGVPTGLWTYDQIFMLNDSSIERLMKVEFVLENNRVKDSLLVIGVDSFGHEYVVRGNTWEGLMDGTWTFRYFQNGNYYREIRAYKKGFLANLVKIEDISADTVENISYPLSPEIIHYLDGSDKAPGVANLPLSLVFSDGYPRTHNLIQIQNAGSNIINRAIERIFAFEDSYFENHGLPIGTNRMVYPLTDREVELIDLWPELLNEYENKVALLSNVINDDEIRPLPQYNLLKSWISHQRGVLDYINPWSSIFNSEGIIYYNRSGLIYEYAQNKFKSDTLYTISDAHAIINYTLGELEEEHLLSYMVNNLVSRIKYSDTLLIQYKDAVESIRKEVVFENKKSEIKALKSELDSIYKTDIMMGNVKLVLFETINSRFLGKWFTETYSLFADSVIDLERKIEFADFVKEQLTIISGWKNMINSIRPGYNFIDSLYTEYVFDAYTFNERFPVRIKKRLYEFVMEDTYPQLILEAQNAKTIDSFQVSLERIHKLFDRMKTLVYVETRELERQLRGNMAKDQKLKLLNSY